MKREDEQNMMNFKMDSDLDLHVSIKVAGIGGRSAVNHMIESGMKSVGFIAMDRDKLALEYSHAAYKIQLGDRILKGCGTNGNPEKGQQAAEESRDMIAESLKGTLMLFITAGMGGGTGTGAAPVVAEIARSMGILTIGFVTVPFEFEDRKCICSAEKGIVSLHEHVDALVVVPDSQLRYRQQKQRKFKPAENFRKPDELLRQSVQSISSLIDESGLINLDFEDICTIMRDTGYAHIGVGRGRGKDMARLAARSAITSPLLGTPVSGARGVIVDICVPWDVGLDDVYEASQMIQEQIGPDAFMLWGASQNKDLEDEMIVTVIATGINYEPELKSMGGGISNDKK